MMRDEPMSRAFVGAAAVLFCSALSAQGTSTSFDITIEAGKHERKNVPVRVQVPTSDAKIASVTLRGPAGKPLPAQWAKPGLLGEGGALYFTLPLLPAGQSLRLQATLSTDAPPGGEGFAWHD